ncbi:MAG: hypothetical protein ACP5IA_01845 [Sediminispirochaetaceae bacterium]
MKHRVIPFLCFIWEAVRYIIVIHILQSFFNPLQVPEYALFFFWMSSYAFILLAGLMLAGMYPSRYYGVAKIIAVGKILQSFAAVLFVLFDYGVIPVILNILNLSTIQIAAALLQDFIPLIVLSAGLDLLAALILFLWKGQPERTEEADRAEQGKISFSITDLEEE